MGDQPLSAAGFEAELAELEAVVRQLESGDLPLEDALKLFERGIALRDSCQRKLEAAETKIEVLVKRNQETVAEPFLPDKP